MSKKSLSIITFISFLLSSCDIKNVKIGKVAKNSDKVTFSNNDKTISSIFSNAHIRLIATKTYVVNFGESWCVPCIREFKYLNKLKAKYAGDTNIVFFFITKSKEGDYKKINEFSNISTNTVYASKIYDSISRVEMTENSIISVESSTLPMTVIIKNNIIVDKLLIELTEDNIDMFSKSINPLFDAEKQSSYRR